MDDLRKLLAELIENPKREMASAPLFPSQLLTVVKRLIRLLDDKYVHFVAGALWAMRRYDGRYYGVDTNNKLHSEVL